MVALVVESSGIIRAVQPRLLLLHSKSRDQLRFFKSSACRIDSVRLTEQLLHPDDNGAICEGGICAVMIQVLSCGLYSICSLWTKMTLSPL